MSLYVDIHKIDKISVEDVKKAHAADLSVQDQYGVKYLQFWVNKEAALAFYLVEGPDKESCTQVHRQAHGGMPCNIVEVEMDYFKLFMEESMSVDNGWGKNDPGYRHLMVMDMRRNTHIDNVDDYKILLMPLKPKNLVLDKIMRFKGRLVEKLEDDSLVGVFNSAINAVRCAKETQNELARKKTKYPNEPEWDISFRIALNSGNSVTENAGFFNELLKASRRLCLVARENEILVSATTRKMCSLEDIHPLKSITSREEIFIHRLFDLAEQNLSNKNFCLNLLVRKLGVSRPQLYRKILAITGLSPNQFISSIRMKRALTLMKRRFGNISEIALEVGYQNPSYFTKCFQKNFGCKPSEFIRISNYA
jgi:AraC-like DNA-binding protein